MVSLKLQRANYQLAVTINHHARTASATGATQATTDARGRDAQFDCTSKGVEILDTPVNPIAQVWIDCELKADVELCRIAIGLRQSAQMRLWLVIEEYARLTGYNHLTRQALSELLDKYSIKWSWQNLHRWLRQGHGLYWNLHLDTVWLIGYERLSKAVVNLALTTKNKKLKSLVNLVVTNAPGQRRSMYVNMRSNNLHQFEASCYAAWHASKDGLPISRYVLTRLWGRDVKSLILLEKTANVKPIHTFAHFTGDHSHLVPHHEEGGYRGGVIEYTVKGRKHWSAEHSNAYKTPSIRQHPYRGKSRRVFSVIRNLIESDASVSSFGQGVVDPDRLIRNGRLVYADAKKAKASAKKYPQRIERYVIKGFDSRSNMHIECAPEGRAQISMRACEYASDVLLTKECLEIVNRPF